MSNRMLGMLPMSLSELDDEIIRVGTLVADHQNSALGVCLSTNDDDFLTAFEEIQQRYLSLRENFDDIVQEHAETPVSDAEADPLTTRFLLSLQASPQAQRTILSEAFSIEKDLLSLFQKTGIIPASPSPSPPEIS